MPCTTASRPATWGEAWSLRRAGREADAVAAYRAAAGEALADGRYADAAEAMEHAGDALAAESLWGLAVHDLRARGLHDRADRLVTRWAAGAVPGPEAA